MRSATSTVDLRDLDSVLFISNKQFNKPTEMTWGDAEEKQFQEKKGKAHRIFKYLATNPSCNDIGLSTFIQRLILRNRTGEMRVEYAHSGQTTGHDP